MNWAVAFPNIQNGGGFTITSPPTDEYNCIAWAASDHRRWWWPHPEHYWPPQAPRELTMDAFVRAYALCGYSPCQDGSLEVGVEKIAIYAKATGEPKHASRQLATGRWTSKLGQSEDIEHDANGLDGLNTERSFNL
jgi:hypothetical protein